MRGHAVVVVGMICLSGCMEGSKPSPLSRNGTGTSPATGVKSLYERIGGEAVIVKIVDDLVANVIADEKIKAVHKKHFMEGDVAGLKRKLVDQIGEATGGPQKYRGKSMKEAHRGLAITDADFDALAADLVKALDQNKIGEAEKKELVQLFGSMRRDVVEKSE
ncbi:MAG: group 1 truncated hemoglobin [Gemmataceae bacterium]|nr:group 1 truncated hemoglobin [Gemmataceae bacterium]MDW8267119.1 group 1 truncated hemoglobin [Gemmataceae bacterium]